MSEGRVLCIGDIHGCLMELGRLLDSLALTEADRLVFLGDYIDRGDASAQTIDLMLDLKRALPRTVFLRGNHEEMLLDFLGFGGTHGGIFVRAGGAATLMSYGVDPDARGDLAEDMRLRMSEDHIAFFREALVLSHTEGPWAFVHAGVRPGVALADQHADDLLWIREEFFAAEHAFPETVMFGHTPQRDVHFSPARRVGMDTGCVYGGRLSALDLTGELLHQVKRGSPDVSVREVSAELGCTR
ncbi:MAG: metallophosphoesterase family protein [Candidatus Binatia bacterium]|nr:metallophosphoesterase family protein [Candidatus Binatia bacterium]